MMVESESSKPKLLLEVIAFSKSSTALQPWMHLYKMPGKKPDASGNPIDCKKKLIPLQYQPCPTLAAAMAATCKNNLDFFVEIC